MIRPELIRDIEVLAGIELVYANQKFPAFASPHEGYAVLLEEFEELMDELRFFESYKRALWDGIKKNENVTQYVDGMEKSAIKTVAEAIQVAAMCKKYRDSLGRNG